MSTPPPSRPALSITLPPSFEFHYNDGQLPKTPDHEEQQQIAQPPPPPRQTYRVRRKRAAIPFETSVGMLESDADTAIPTIEMSEAMSETSSPVVKTTPSVKGFLSPLPDVQRFVTPPKTPAPSLTALVSNESPSHEWALITDSRDQKRAFERFGSVGSSFSDSSISSAGSSGFSAPNGSNTSPESEPFDPFTEVRTEDGGTEDGATEYDDLLNFANNQAKRAKRNHGIRWTQAMNDHLESTYVMYLRDPKVTPFKMLPGIAPPLGVCYRVAAKAKRTWSQQKASTPTLLDPMFESQKSQREGSPDTIRPDSSGKKNSKHQPQWPRSDASVRKRLRKLVKSRPSLSAHYQRLLRTRSPSPFTTSSSTMGRSSEPPTSAFSGRDMKMSLVTSTAASMQPEGPLAQLSSDDTALGNTPTRPRSQRSSRPADWFARIGRSQAHEKSLSMQSDLNVETATTQPATTLASPFDEASHRSHLLHSMSTTKSLGRSKFNRQNAKVPSLDSPFAMPAADSLPRSLKRRFKSDEEKPRRPGVGDAFEAPAEESNIVRNRGFSVGAVRATGNLTRMFDPTEPTPPVPSSAYADQEMTEAPPMPDSSDVGPVGSHSAPRRLAEPVPRLRSPFTATPSKDRQYSTFPRSYIRTDSNPQPFYDRLRELAQD